MRRSILPLWVSLLPFSVGALRRFAVRAPSGSSSDQEKLSQSSSTRLPDDETRSISASSSRTPTVGDAVRVWSLSKKTWYDGFVRMVAHAPLTFPVKPAEDGQSEEIPEGSLFISYYGTDAKRGSGAKPQLQRAKWVSPQDIPRDIHLADAQPRYQGRPTVADPSHHVEEVVVGGVSGVDLSRWTLEKGAGVWRGTGSPGTHPAELGSREMGPGFIGQMGGGRGGQGSMKPAWVWGRYAKFFRSDRTLLATEWIPEHTMVGRRKSIKPSGDEKSPLLGAGTDQQPKGTGVENQTTVCPRERAP